MNTTDRNAANLTAFHNLNSLSVYEKVEHIFDLIGDLEAAEDPRMEGHLRALTMLAGSALMDLELQAEDNLINA